jgi:tagaturonate epimerase
MIPWLTDQFNHRELDAAAEVLAAAASTFAAGSGSDDIGSSHTGIHTFQCYPLSVQEQAGCIFGMLRADSSTDYLLIVSSSTMAAEDILPQFEGTRFSAEARSCLLCPASQANYTALSGVFPWIKPSPTGNYTSFGTGDRLGLASPGHIAAFRNSDTVPILAQQSKRELQLTGRSYGEVIRSAGWAVFASGFTRPWGADGDHLKYTEDIADALEQGCTMITADLSEHLFFHTSAMPADEKAAAYEALDPRYRKRIEKEYSGIIRVDPELTLEFTREVLTDIVLTYYAAVEHAARLYKEAERQMGGNAFDFEISIDETEVPTSPESHYFTALELGHLGVAFTSLAPRFVGEFQKGIDYIGDREAFSRDFSRHAIIAGALGYKISVHSSSDKFSVYPAIGKRARGPYHVKTSGTNWLTALEVVALEDPELFRELLRFAYTVFNTASAY